MFGIKKATFSLIAALVVVLTSQPAFANTVDCAQDGEWYICVLRNGAVVEFFGSPATGLHLVTVEVFTEPNLCDFVSIC